MENPQKSIDKMVIELLDSKKITKNKVTNDLKTIERPLDRIDYLNQLMTFTNLGVGKTGVLETEESLSSLLTELQNKEIEDAKYKSDRDSLTDVYNRGQIERRMRAPLEKYCVLMMDIDRFKKINDRYGHKVGDIVLVNFAKIVMQTVRENFVGRYGGEEFYVELNQIDLEGGRKIADRIRKAVEENTMPYVIEDLRKESDEKLISRLKGKKVTVSIGVANEQQGKSPYEVRDRADNALYQAKKYGRNKVVIYGENPLNNIGDFRKTTFLFGNGIRKILDKGSELTDKIISYSTKH